MNKILDEILKEKLEFCEERDKKGRLSYTFNSEEANMVVGEIVEEAQKRVTAAMRAQSNDQPPRYKLVFHAQFGENLQHMVRSASRCLWDAEHDNSASASWSNVRRPPPRCAAPRACRAAPAPPTSPRLVHRTHAQPKVYAVAMCFAMYYE